MAINKFQRSGLTYYWKPNIAFSETTRPIERKKGGKDQESIQSCTTPDPEYHMGR